jgi:hypothetical protein
MPMHIFFNSAIINSECTVLKFTIVGGHLLKLLSISGGEVSKNVSNILDLDIEVIQVWTH